MKDLISVVVPIYNVEKYLRKCIDSIISQTYDNIEIILVNDGSTDNCLKICNEYKEKDGRIKIINKKNGGLSEARNAGLKKATGKYICFIDSDDYINEKYLEELYNLIIDNNAQIAVCNFENVDENGISISKKEILSHVITGKKTIERLYDKNLCPICVITCNKLYDINLFENIIFPVGKIHEDEFITYKLFYLAEKVAITPKILYYYRQVHTSITNKKFNIKRLDAIEALQERVDFFKENNEENLYKLTLIEYEKKLITYYMKCKKNIYNSKKIQKKIIRKYRESYCQVIKFRECSIINKAKFTIACISPILYYIMKMLIHKIEFREKFIRNRRKNEKSVIYSHSRFTYTTISCAILKMV